MTCQAVNKLFVNYATYVTHRRECVCNVRHWNRSYRCLFSMDYDRFSQQTSTDRIHRSFETFPITFFIPNSKFGCLFPAFSLRSEWSCRHLHFPNVSLHMRRAMHFGRNGLSVICRWGNLLLCACSHTYNAWSRLFSRVLWQQPWY